MAIISFTGGHVFTNGYIIDHAGECIVVDAPALIHELVKEKGLKPTHLLLTHQHFDHTEDVQALQEMGVKVVSHSPYSESLIRQKEARENWGIPVQIEPFTPDILLDGKDSFEVGSLKFIVSHVPGHSPDSITFYCEEMGAVFTGDTLMAGGCGRTDLPGGCAKTLFEGIRTKLYTLPDDTVSLSGHGPETTIGHEKEHNDFV